MEDDRRLHGPSRQGSPLAGWSSGGARSQGGPRARARRGRPRVNHHSAFSGPVFEALRDDGYGAGRGRRLAEFYQLRVVVVPTHRPMIRADRDDEVFARRGDKEAAVVSEIAQANRAGRPVLVGTISVEESERLAARIREAGISCEVLNAKNDAMEARIIARAAAPWPSRSRPTWRGRGTDIRLGGEDEAARAAVAAGSAASTFSGPIATTRCGWTAAPRPGRTSG